MVLNYVDVGL